MQAVLDSTLLSANFGASSMGSQYQQQHYPSRLNYGTVYEKQQPRLVPQRTDIKDATTVSTSSPADISTPSSTTTTTSTSTTPSSFICILSPLGTILSTSPIYNHISGTSIMDYVHPDDLDQFISSMSAIISNGTSLQMMYRLKFFNQYKVYEGLGRPSNEEFDGYQGMVLISKVIEHESNVSNVLTNDDSIFSRRQATRLQKGLIINQPSKLEYEQAAIPITPIERAIYDHSPLSAGGYQTISPFEEDLSNSSSSSLLSLNPLSTPSLLSFDEAANWPIDASAAATPYSKSYSYIEVNNDTADLKSPPRSNEELATTTQLNTINSLQNHSYWDNITNSELVSPNFFIPDTPSYSPTASYFDSAAQARAKSYSLPGLFDINSEVRYHPPTSQVSQHSQASQSIDFSNYSLSMKKSIDPYKKAKKLVNKTPASTTLPTIPTITKRRKSKQHNRDELVSYVCTECGVKESPEWRKGPKGPKTLCNACGLRWAKWTRQQNEEKQ